MKYIVCIAVVGGLVYAIRSGWAKIGLEKVTDTMEKTEKRMRDHLDGAESTDEKSDEKSDE